jgi:hypothetical protein
MPLAMPQLPKFWEISQAFKSAKEIPGEEIPPEKVVEIALKNNLPSISYTPKYFLYLH